MADEEPELLNVEADEVQRLPTPVADASGVEVATQTTRPPSPEPPSPPAVIRPPSVSLEELLNQEHETFAGDKTEERDLRCKILTRLQALPREQWFSTSLMRRLTVVKHVILVFKPTRLSVDARVRLVSRIMRTWSDGSDEYDHWAAYYLPQVLLFLFELAPDQLLPSRLQRAWWSVASPK